MTIAPPPADITATRPKAVPRPRDSDRLSPALRRAFLAPPTLDIELEQLIALIDRRDTTH